MISSIKKNAIHYIEYVKSDREPTILSKKSKPNETVKDIYYPSQKMHYEITEILVKWLKNNDQIISKDNKATTKSNSSIAVAEKNTNSLCCSKTRSDKLFVVIVALPRSGSTLVMRLLNRMPNTNIFGENFGALKKLYQFQKSLEKTLEWPDKGYYIPLSRQEYEKEKSHTIAWYNEFDLNEIKSGLRNLILETFDKNNNYKTIGFKEIRYSLVTSNDVQTDPFVCDEYANFEQELHFLVEVFDKNVKFIFNIRNDIDAIIKSGWQCFQQKNAYSEIGKVINNYKKFARKYSRRSLLIEYEDLIGNQKDNIEKLSNFLEFNSEHNIESLLSEFSQITR